ncbi:hypothetical protein M1446_04800 [Candidatus Dependentiae bacterium]|nr:hypothetical protein [Candidatus Dependentiae bacterium]
MNRLYKLFFILFLINSNIFAISRSIFVPRSTTRDSTLELSQSNYFFYHNEDRCAKYRPWFYYFFSPFVQRSFNDKDLAKYFLKCNKSCLSIREDGLGDVGSLWFAAMTPIGSFFNSTYSVRPVRTAYGVYFNMYFDLCYGLWAGIEAAAMGVHHNLKPCENVTSPAGSICNFKTFSDAIDNCEFKAGRFTKCKLTKGGVDDIQVKFGHNYYFREDDHFGSYLVLSIPTGERQSSQFAFEPLIGSRHVGLGFGLNADFNLYGCEDHSLNWMFDFKYLYLFQARQKRLFDLCANGDWSRYLQVVKNQPTSLQGLAGVNFFSQEVKVTPQSDINFWTAFHYQHCEYNFEFGYNLWWRQKEKICQICPNPSVAIANLPGFPTFQGGSASSANISQAILPPNQIPTDSTFTTVGNFNFNSGKTPAVLTHKLYASFAYDYFMCSHPAIVGITTACEFATGCNKRNALEQWQIFLTLGFTY